MNDIINLNSRSEKSYLKRLKRLNESDGSECKTYLLKLSNPYLRNGFTDTNKKFIDPSGGPMIVEEEFLEEAGATVESIDFVEGYGYTITFK